MPAAADIAKAALWSVAAVVTTFATWHVVARDEPRIAATRADARDVEAKLNRARDLLHRRIALRMARERIVSDIRHRGIGDDATSALLGAVETTSRNAGIAVVTIEPGAKEGRADLWLRPRSQRLVVRGAFSAFLRFVTALSREDPLLDVGTVAIDAVKTRGGTTLVYTLSATSYRVTAPTKGL